MDGSGPAEIIPPNLTEDGKLHLIYPKTAVGDNVKVVHSGGGGAGVVFIGPKGRIGADRGRIFADPPSLFDTPLGAQDVHLYDSRSHYRNFVDCVLSRRKPICESRIGASSVTVCHLSNIAWWTGRALKWDPVKHQIIGDPEAARWLSRPKRAPWDQYGV
jgi:hypothetical protein